MDERLTLDLNSRVRNRGTNQGRQNLSSTLERRRDHCSAEGARPGQRRERRGEIERGSSENVESAHRPICTNTYPNDELWDDTTYGLLRDVQDHYASVSCATDRYESPVCLLIRSNRVTESLLVPHSLRCTRRQLLFGVLILGGQLVKCY
jgi:hypothetical protein